MELVFHRVFRGTDHLYYSYVIFTVNCRVPGELQDFTGITGFQGNYRISGELQGLSRPFQTSGELQFNCHKFQDFVGRYFNKLS